MPKTISIRLGLAAAVAAAGLAMSACAPIPVRLDGPMSGTETNLAVGQPLSVRLSNVTPDDGAWQFADQGPKAVTFEGRDVRPPENGVRQLESFNFTAAAAGADQLTFNYVKKDGEIGDQIVIAANVK